MAGIDELIDKSLDTKLNERVAALKSDLTLLRPWVGMREVEELVGMKNQKITYNFIHNKDTGKDCEAKQLGLVRKIDNQWRFKNPEFFNYLHDDYWME